jgi:hypothetical protein
MTALAPPRPTPHPVVAPVYRMRVASAPPGAGLLNGSVVFLGPGVRVVRFGYHGRLEVVSKSGVTQHTPLHGPFLEALLQLPMGRHIPFESWGEGDWVFWALGGPLTGWLVGEWFGDQPPSPPPGMADFARGAVGAGVFDLIETMLVSGPTSI